LAPFILSKQPLPRGQPKAAGGHQERLIVIPQSLRCDAIIFLLWFQIDYGLADLSAVSRKYGVVSEGWRWWRS
jgi:hypothetical protein